MRRLVGGLLLGLVLGHAGSGLAARLLTGDYSDPILAGWSVQIGMRTICHDPWVDGILRTISCP